MSQIRLSFRMKCLCVVALYAVVLFQSGATWQMAHPFAGEDWPNNKPLPVGGMVDKNDIHYVVVLKRNPPLFMTPAGGGRGKGEGFSWSCEIPAPFVTGEHQIALWPLDGDSNEIVRNFDMVDP